MMKNKLLPFFFCFILFSAFHCNAKEWKRAYLASYPQSGNHWARYLIEEATHIATSSVYPDPEPPRHMKHVFPWGGFCSDHGYQGDCRYPTKDDVVLVKTHYPYPYKQTKYDRRPYKVAIYIVRHPIDSFGSRYEKLPKGRPQEKIPKQRIKDLIESWRTVATFWNKQKHVLIIRYEDMLTDPATELRKMLLALDYEFSEEDIERAVTKHPPQGYMLKHLDKFRQSDLELISEELGDLLAQYDYAIPL